MMNLNGDVLNPQTENFYHLVIFARGQKKEEQNGQRSFKDSHFENG